MLKAILLTVILAACACGGRSLCCGMKRRSNMLSDLLAGLRVLRLRMLNSMEPIGVLLRKSDAALLRRLGDCLRDGHGLQACWQQLRLSESRRGGMLDCLTTDDVAILDDLLRNLGQSGREEQSELFAATIARMEDACSVARQRFLDASKTYTALGALMGVALCILLV